MNTNILSRLDTTPEAFASLYWAGIPLFDKGCFKKLNSLVKKINGDIDIKFKSGEIKKKEEQLKGKIAFNYDVQAMLYILHEKLAARGLLLTLLHDKRTLDSMSMLHLFVQDAKTYTSVSTQEYIVCTMQEEDKPLLKEMFVNGEAYTLVMNQRNYFSGRFNLDYEEVDNRLYAHSISESDFTQTLTNKAEAALHNGTWFQIIEHNTNGTYIRTTSIDGRRTYATVWLTEKDFEIITKHLLQASAIAQQRACPVIVAELDVYSEQKRGDMETLILSRTQLQELSDCLAAL